MAYSRAAKASAVRKMQMGLQIKIIVISLTVVIAFSCSSTRTYNWPPDKVADTSSIDSLNAAYNYETAETLLGWQKPKSPANLLLKLDSLHNNPNQVLIDEITGWVRENEKAIEAMLEGAKKPYCDFSFGSPKPFMTHYDKNRIYPELWNVLDLMLFHAWHYSQIDQPDSAIYMISSGLNVLSHLESQLEGVFLAKLIEVMALQHVARSMQYLVDKTDDENRLRELITLSETYLKNRNNMEAAMLEQLFLRVDFKELAETTLVKTIAEQIDSVQTTLDYQNLDPGVSDSIHTIIDQLGYDFEQNTEEFSRYAEQEYLRNEYKLYTSYITGFRENDPSKVKIDHDFNTTWYSLRMARTMLFFNPDNPKLPIKLMGKMTGEAFYFGGRVDFRHYIEPYHMIETELRIAHRAAQIKLSKLTGDKISITEGLDPFNNFNPLKVANMKNKFVVYSLGPDRRDGNGVNLDTYRNDDQNWSGFDIGFDFSW